MKNGQKQLIEAYLKRAEQIIGKRTPAEIAHDDTVVAGLEAGLPIVMALASAGQKHPAERISWDPDNLKDIAEHYDYLKNHTQILRKLRNRKPK